MAMMYLLSLEPVPTPNLSTAFGMAGTDKQFIAVANDQDDFEQGASFQDFVDLYMAVMDAITPQGILIQYLL